MAAGTWHYHATLSCGHDVAFDLNVNVVAVAQEQKADAVVEFPCSKCIDKHTRSVSLNLVGENIRICGCGKGFPPNPSQN